jgi:hypothetical protein
VGLQPNSGQPVRHLRGQQTLDRIVVALLAPAADHVVTLVELRDERRDVRRVVLQVRVQGNDHVAPGVRETRAQGSGLPEVPSETDHADPWIRRLEALEILETAVGAAIVDEDQLVFVPARQRAGDLLVQSRQVLLLVQEGHHHRQLRLLRVIRCLRHILSEPGLFRKSLSYRQKDPPATKVHERIIDYAASAGQLK